MVINPTVFVDIHFLEGLFFFKVGWPFPIFSDFWLLTMAHMKKTHETRTGFVVMTWNNYNPNELEKPCITKGLATCQSLGARFSHVTFGAYGGPRRILLNNPSWTLTNGYPKWRHILSRRYILQSIIVDTRWAPTSYTWSYNHYKWPFKWVLVGL